MADLVGAPPPSEPTTPRGGDATPGHEWVRPPVPGPSPRRDDARATKIALTVVGALFLPVLLITPFVRTTQHRRHVRNEHSLYEQFGWPGVIGVWVFFLALAVITFVIYRAMRPRRSSPPATGEQGSPPSAHSD